MRKPDFAYAKTKAQISCAVIELLIGAFVFATRIVQFLFYLNPKFPASSPTLFYDCTNRFVSELVGNPEDLFSRVMALIKDVVYMVAALKLNKTRSNNL